MVKENHINGLLIKEEETTEADTTTAATTDETTTDTETVTDSQTAPAAEDSKETTGVPNSKKAVRCIAAGYSGITTRRRLHNPQEEITE